jgi:AcrR family transcriptional regulator
VAVGRPATPLLSTERIAAAAIALVDRTGSFTVAQVAEALGVRPSSLYNHVTGKAQILEAMRAAVFAAVPAGSGGADGTWDQRARVLLRAYRDAFAAHPRLVPLLTGQTVSAPDAMRIYDELAQILARAGLSSARLLDVITVLDSFVIGSALDLVAPDEVWAADQAGTPEQVHAIKSADAGRTRADRAFELGLDLLLSGLAVLPS